MRKRCRRKIWSTPAIPIAFGLTRAGLNKCRLLGAAAIDALHRGEGTEDHLAQLKQIADYCMLLSDRLAVDQSVTDADQLAATKMAAAVGLETIAALHQAGLDETGPRRSTDLDRATLLTLLDANDALDAVATRRQARDVMVEMVRALATQP